MQPQMQQMTRWMPLVVIIVAGLLVGVGVGYLIWSPGASNYAVVSTSKEATRTVRVDDFTVTYPSVAFAKPGSDSSLTITLTNMRSYSVFATVSLALVRNSGIDTATISALTTDSYTVTLTSYGTGSDIISFKPTSTGYAFFDAMVNGDLAGSIAVYVVPS